MGTGISLEYMELFKDDWFLLSDMFDFFLGDPIGKGNSRSVFEFRFDKKYVVKVDRSGMTHNFAEWDIWQNATEQMRQYLAPCHSLSSCGRFLLMEKTEVITLNDLPKEIPDFFMDFKVQNWGKIENRIVCHDYANHKFYSKGHGMMEPKWWSDTFQLPEDYKKDEVSEAKKED